MGPPVIGRWDKVFIIDIHRDGEPEFALGARGNGQAQTAATARVRDSLWMEDERQHEERHAEREGRKDSHDGRACYIPASMVSSAMPT